VGKLRDISWYLVSQAGQMLVALALTPVYTRLIAPEEFGAHSMASLVVVYGTMLANWGLPVAYERFFFANQGPDRARVLSTVCGFSALCLGLLTLAVWALHGAIARHLLDAAYWYPLVPVVFFTGALTYLSSLCMLELRNQQRVREYVLLDTTRFALIHGISLWLVLGPGWGIWAQVIGAGVAQVYAIGVLIAWFGVKRLFTIDWTLLRQCLVYGRPIVARIWFGALSHTLDKYLLGSLASLAILGVYAKAQMWATMAVVFMTTLENVYMPLWNRRLYGGADAPTQTVGRLFTEYCVVSLGPCVALCCLTREVVTVLAPPAYHGAIPLLAVLAWVYALAAFGKLYGSVVNYLKLLKQTTPVSIGAEFATIGLVVLLVPRWGAMGAVIAFVAPRVVTTAYSGLLCHRRLALDLEHRFLVGTYVLLTAGTLLTVADYYGQWPWPLSLASRGLVVVLLGWVFIHGLGRQRVAELVGRLRRRVGC
jgi:O-antigen/teichoic acid export membrane protein